MPKDRDLISLLEAGAVATPEKPLYSFLDRELRCTDTLTYKSLFDEALVLACQLQRCGLNRTPVLLIQQKNIEFVRSFWACLLAGAWPMPCARPRGKKWSQLLTLAVQSRAAAIMTSSAIARLIPAQALLPVPIVVSDTTPAGMPIDIGELNKVWVRPSICADDIAFIQYTSGSMSNPKGVVITHGNVMSNLAAISRAFSCSDRDIGLSWLPLHHDMGLIGHVLQPVFAGIHNYFLNPTDFLANPCLWIEAISTFHVTIAGGPAFSYGFCTRQRRHQTGKLQLDQWRIAYCGADRIAAETLRQFERRYAESGFKRDAWFPCYGLAESTLFVCGTKGVGLSTGVDGNEHYVCIGALDDGDSCGDADIKVVDPVSRMVCLEGDIGEIWVASDSVSPGYYHQSILSRQSFNLLIEGRGAYFRTGDLGFIVNRHLYFTGSLKNVIKVRGRSLHAEDIETLLQLETLDTGLQRCVAVGIQVDNVDSFVILAEHRSRRPTQQLTGIGQLQRQLKNLVCDTFGVTPHAVLILPSASLPVSSSGKPVRSLCLDIYNDLTKTPCNKSSIMPRGLTHSPMEAGSNA
ncbi:fatty acyl-AMP ligase [Gammaproteobacteria bacterium LSUCC0112]|nr:fatty acyl-AMP ligase [Gammaproteobacteria bacterium LSUCC0112]